jgi:hypothetical protein
VSALPGRNRLRHRGGGAHWGGTVLHSGSAISFARCQHGREWRALCGSSTSSMVLMVTRSSSAPRNLRRCCSAKDRARKPNLMSAWWRRSLREPPTLNRLPGRQALGRDTVTRGRRGIRPVQGDGSPLHTSQIAMSARKLARLPLDRSQCSQRPRFPKSS